MVKELTIIWGLGASYFDKEYGQGLLKKFNHAEYIKKKLYPPLKLYYRDSITGELEEV